MEEEATRSFVLRRLIVIPPRGKKNNKIYMTRLCLCRCSDSRFSVINVFIYDVEVKVPRPREASEKKGNFVLAVNVRAESTFFMSRARN